MWLILSGTRQFVKKAGNWTKIGGCQLDKNNVLTAVLNSERKQQTTEIIGSTSNSCKINYTSVFQTRIHWLGSSSRKTWTKRADLPRKSLLSSPSARKFISARLLSVISVAMICQLLKCMCRSWMLFVLHNLWPFNLQHLDVKLTINNWTQSLKENSKNFETIKMFQRLLKKHPFWKNICKCQAPLL